MKITVTPTRTRTSEELAERFRDALRRSGLSLDRLAVRLGERGHRVSRTTLSNWQRGRTRPVRSDSLAAIPDLEVLLGLAPGSLWSDGLDASADAEGSFETLSLHESSFVGERGVTVRRETRQIVRATGRTISHLDLRVAGEEDPLMTVGTGGVARRPVLDDDGTWRVPIQLSHRLAAGETHFLELAWEGTARRMRRVVAEPIAQLLMRTTISGERIPKEMLVRAGSHTQRVGVDGQGTAHFLVLQPRAGDYGMTGVEPASVAGYHWP